MTGKRVCRSSRNEKANRQKPSKSLSAIMARHVAGDRLEVFAG